MLHTLWSKAKHEDDYNKSEWKDLERHLLRQPPRSVENQDAHGLLKRLWGKAEGTVEYDESEWKTLRHNLLRARSVPQ